MRQMWQSVSGEGRMIRNSIFSVTSFTDTPFLIFVGDFVQRNRLPICTCNFIYFLMDGFFDVLIIQQEKIWHDILNIFRKIVTFLKLWWFAVLALTRESI